MEDDASDRRPEARARERAGSAPRPGEAAGKHPRLPAPPRVRMTHKALRLLADFGGLVRCPLNGEALLAGLPSLVVRDFAELCVVDEVAADGGARRAAWVHAQADKAALLEGLLASHPRDASGSHGQAPPTAPGGHDELDAEPAFAAIARELRLPAAISVPAMAGGRPLAFIHVARHGRYAGSDRAALCELAARLASALENASRHQEVERQVRVRDDFLSIAWHELRTPLTALQLQLQGARELASKRSGAVADEQFGKRLERASNSLEKLRNLLESLLDVSRVSSGRLTLHRESVDLVALARDVVDHFGEAARNAGCELSLTTPGAAAAAAQAKGGGLPSAAAIVGQWDRTRLDQVLANLMANAIKYGAGKPIQVEVSETADHAILRIIDHGIGIAAADVDRVFGRFERAASDPNYGGFGLGLFITRRIVEAHGGTVRVEATPAGGATLVIALPKQPPAGEVISGIELSSRVADDRVRSRGAPSLVAVKEALAFVWEVKDYAIYMIDPFGRVLSWNEGARAIKGYEAEEIIGQSFVRFFTEEDLASDRPARLLARAAAEGRTEDETWRVRKNGERFWADVVITAVHDEDGRLRGFLKVTRDLTQRRRSDELLRQSEERLRLLIESVKDYAIFMLDTSGRVTTWNHGAERINGYRADEAIGQHFSIFYPPEARVGRLPDYELGIAVREGRFEEEGWRVRKDGARFWANVVITAIHDPATGALRGFAKVTRDLTERRRMEEEARSAAEQAGRERLRAEEAQIALRQRDEFISVAAHELRTPLTAVLLKLQSVVHVLQKASAREGREGEARGSQPGEAGESATVFPKLTDRVASSLAQMQRFTDLVERLLDVSRMVRGKLIMRIEETDLANVVERAVEDFREPAAHVGSELRFHRRGTPVGAWDKARIEQIVVNLVANAIKYGAGKPVDITVEATARGGRLTVADQGIGIAREDAERIFSRFERAAPVHHYGGLGLGLYITRSIVEAHGGRIRVESVPEQGATFIVDLPKDPHISVLLARDDGRREAG